MEIEIWSRGRYLCGCMTWTSGFQNVVSGPARSVSFENLDIQIRRPQGSTIIWDPKFVLISFPSNYDVCWSLKTPDQVSKRYSEKQKKASSLRISVLFYSKVVSVCNKFYVIQCLALPSFGISVQNVTFLAGVMWSWDLVYIKIF